MMKINDYTFDGKDIKNIQQVYKINGFVVIKGFFKKKNIRLIKNEIKKLIKKKDINFYYEKVKNKNVIRRIEKVSEYSKKINNIINFKKTFNLIKKLENKQFCLFKDKLNFKYPGGAGFSPHIDGHFLWKDKNNKYQKGWKIYSDNFLSIVTPLEKVDKKNGCIYISSIKNTEILGSSFESISKKLTLNTPNIKKKYLKKFLFYPIILSEGDICIFNWKCAHMSKKNISKNSRMIFYSTYCKVINKNTNIRKKYYLDKTTSRNDDKWKSLQKY